MPSVTRGALIVVEGLDRADRSTVIGKSIDAYLKGEAHQDDHVIHLLFSANRWEAASQIRADIEAGITVVIDRYYYSGIVYSVAKNKPDLTLHWARGPEVGLPRPDVCLFLDIDPEVAAQRGGYGAERYETNTLQVQVRVLFQQLMKRPDGEDIVSIDASRSLDEVHQQMRTVVLETFKDEKMIYPLGQIESWPPPTQG